MPPPPRPALEGLTGCSVLTPEGTATRGRAAPLSQLGMMADCVNIDPPFVDVIDPSHV